MQKTKQKQPFLQRFIPLLTLCMTLLLSAVTSTPLTAHAETLTEETALYYYKFDFGSSTKYPDYHLYESVASTVPIIFYLEDDDVAENHIHAMFTAYGSCSTEYYWTYDGKNVGGNSVNFNNKKAGTTFSNNSFSAMQYTYDYMQGASGHVMIFESKEAALNYINNNDYSGLVDEINPPENGIELPDFDNIQIANNGSIALTDFHADNVVNVSWSGITGTDSDTINNSFVTVEFGYSTEQSAGTATSVLTYDRGFLVTDYGFTIPIEDILAMNSGSYLLYIKCTPYHYNMDDVTARLYKGNSSYVYYDEDQNLSWYDQIRNTISSEGQGGLRRGTVYLSDFFLTGVSVGDFDILGRRQISWTGTTKDTDVFLVSDDNTQVIVTYMVTNNDDDYTTTPQLHTILTIGDGSFWVNYGEILEESENNNFAWDGEIRLTPTYLSNGILYIGEQTVINLGDNSIRNVGVNSDGSLNTEQQENNVNRETSTVANYTDVFVSYLQSLVAGLGSLPSLFQAVFSFIPAIYTNAIGITLSIILILRILGR